MSVPTESKVPEKPGLYRATHKGTANKFAIDVKPHEICDVLVAHVAGWEGHYSLEAFTDWTGPFPETLTPPVALPAGAEAEQLQEIINFINNYRMQLLWKKPHRGGLNESETQWLDSLQAITAFVADRIAPIPDLKPLPRGAAP